MLQNNFLFYHFYLKNRNQGKTKRFYYFTWKENIFCFKNDITYRYPRNSYQYPAAFEHREPRLLNTFQPRESRIRPGAHVRRAARVTLQPRPVTVDIFLQRDPHAAHYSSRQYISHIDAIGKNDACRSCAPVFRVVCHRSSSLIAGSSISSALGLTLVTSASSFRLIRSRGSRCESCSYRTSSSFSAATPHSQAVARSGRFPADRAKSVSTNRTLYARLMN